MSEPPASAVREETVEQALPAELAHAHALHEVSNALTVVSGWLEIARTRAAEGPARDAIELAVAYARLGHDIARRAIGAEIAHVEVERSASGLARAAVLGVTPEAERKNVLLRLESATGTDDLVRDCGAVSQILLNLMLNAVAFSPHGGAVTLALCEADGMFVFLVSDEGPGVSSERARVIFESPHTTRAGGAGIGLPHSKALADTCGGRLRLVKTGPGACFELAWPRAERTNSTRHPSAPAARLEGLRILVLEDDEAVLGLIELALEARGAEVVRAVCAEDLERLMAEHGGFAAALLDLSPIAADPSAAMAALRNAAGAVPVVLISGTAIGVPDILQPDIKAWVRKPFEMSEVIDVIRDLVTGR